MHAATFVSYPIWLLVNYVPTPCGFEIKMDRFGNLNTDTSQPTRQVGEVGNAVMVPGQDALVDTNMMRAHLYAGLGYPHCFRYHGYVDDVAARQFERIMQMPRKTPRAVEVDDGFVEWVRALHTWQAYASSTSEGRADACDFEALRTVMDPPASVRQLLC